LIWNFASKVDVEIFMDFATGAESEEVIGAKQHGKKTTMLDMLEPESHNNTALQSATGEEVGEFHPKALAGAGPATKSFEEFKRLADRWMDFFGDMRQPAVWKLCEDTAVANENIDAGLNWIALPSNIADQSSKSQEEMQGEEATMRVPKIFSWRIVLGATKILATDDASFELVKHSIFIQLSFVDIHHSDCLFIGAWMTDFPDLQMKQTEKFFVKGLHPSSFESGRQAKNFEESMRFGEEWCRVRAGVTKLWQHSGREGLSVWSKRWMCWIDR